jgi:hypothetical protein
MLQTATTGDKICVLFRTITAVSGGVVAYGLTTAFTLESMVGCTKGTIRSVNNGDDRHYFCWVTITDNDWTFRARETTLKSLGGFGGVITFFHRITVSDDIQEGGKIDSTHIAASDMTLQFSSGQHRQGLSLYRSGNNATPNTHAHHGIPENAGEIKFSQFANAFRHRTATQNDQSNAANKSDGSMTNLSSMVYTAGVSNAFTTQSGGGKGGGGTIYNWDIDHGFSNAASGYSPTLGSISNGGRVSGLGDHPRDNGANFSRVASYRNVQTTTSSTPNPTQFQLRLHSLENGSGFEGTGRTSTGSGSASSSVAGWNKLFIVEVDDAVLRYTLLDIDSATTTNYTHTNNDYSDIVWTSGGFSMSSGKEYMMMFLK